MTTPPPSNDDATTAAAFQPTRRHWTGFWAMIVQQTQNAFNDKAAQFILIPLAAAVGFALPGNIGVETAAGAIIALPFVLFAPLAGWFSDRYSKRDVMLAMAVAQVAILGWISLGVWQGNLGMALTGFFALALQSAIFSPAKIGINKELVGSRYLGFAAGVQQMMAMLAILIGQVVAGWWFDTRYVALGATPDAAKKAALWPLCMLTLLSLPAVLMAWMVPRVPAQGFKPFRIKHLFGHFRDLGELWRDAGLRRGAFGVAFFWGFAAYLNLWSVKVAKEITGGEAGFGTLSSKYMAAASIGMVLGFGFASWLLRRRIELGWVPLAGAAMTVGSVVLAFMHPTGWGFLAGLGGLAFAGAVFLAPLNAWMQDNYPANKRGELQAAVNLQDCFAGILSLLVVEGLLRLAEVCGLGTLAGLRGQLLVVALACAGITAMVIRLLPRDFIRLLILGLLRTFYRIRAVHPDRVPATGGVLLLPNHVTYADAFFLSAACPRPIRFVMDEVFMAKGWIRLSAKLFGTVPIRRDQPLDAIRVVIDALRNGEVVCLFPEGQLTRTGALCELRRGFELIARKAGHPLVPVWCDGVWGSVFSFERGRFFRKIPYHIPYGLVVAFGRPIEPRGLDTAVVRDAIHRASSEAIGRRFLKPGWGMKLPAAHIPDEAVGRMKSCGKHERRRLWINGHQIGQVNALQRRETLHLLEGDPLPATLPALALAFPELHGCRLMLHAKLPAEPAGAWIGGDVLRAEFATLPAAHGVRFFDFGPAPFSAPGCDGLLHLPCLARGGVVIAMSMPHPPQPQPDSEFQPGHKPGSFGILLPGWTLHADASGNLRAHGPAAPRGGIALPGVARIDEGGFVFPAS